MKKLHATGFLVVAAISLSACTSASKDGGTSTAPATKATQDNNAASLVPADVKSKGTYTVAMDASYAPFEYFGSDNKTIIGFDADLSTAIAGKLGLQPKLVNAGFDTILPGLAAKKYDAGTSAFSVTPERVKTVSFVPYLAAGTGIAVAPGNPKKLKMDPMVLCGNTIAAQKGSVQGIQQLPDISKSCSGAGKQSVTIRLFPSQNEANLAVTSGRAEAVMADSVSLSYQAKQSGGKFELAPGGEYKPADIGVALPKGSTLEPAIAAAVKVLVSDGTIPKLMKKWAIPASATIKNAG